MKKVALALMVTVATFCYSVSLHAQGVEDGTVVIPSTNTWNFMKYGGHQPSLYTGTVNVSIPIYTYEDGDFELPISIDYASNGYMPNILAGMTGLGWRLNCGGMITREVRGIPDEKQLHEWSERAPNYPQIISGYQHLINHQNKNTFITDVGVYVVPYTLEATDGLSCEPDIAMYNYSDILNGYETEPDIYSFNFMGYSGRFMFKMDGSASILESNVPKGELSIKINTEQMTCPFFVITTGNGYEYTFGSGTLGGIYYENFAYEYKCKEDEDGDSPDYPITFYITKIKTPNGREIRFKYADGMIRMLPRQPIDHYAMGQWASVSPQAGVFGSTYSILSGDLMQVEIDDVEVNIIYGRKEKREKFDETRVESYWHSNIAEVICQYNNPVDFTTETLKTCNFYYKYAQSGNPVMLLDSLKISGEGTYKMSYYNDQSFPFLGHKGFDHWGYWRSSSSPIYIQDMVPANAGVNTQVWPIQNDNRASVFSFAVRGMLQKLEYPTKGWTIFEYEPHKYTNIVIREQPNYNPTLKTIPTGEAGGVRIKKITDFASDGSFVEKLYKYEKHENVSSGNLLKVPLYVLQYNTTRPLRYWLSDVAFGYVVDPGIFTVIHVAMVDMSQYLFGQTHIEYSHVKEILSDGSETVYHFTDYSIQPDAEVDAMGFEHYTTIAPAHIDKLTSLMYSLSPRRGKLLSTTMYKNGQPVYKEDIKYKLLSDTSYLIPRTAKSALYPSYIFDDYNLYPETRTIMTYFNQQTLIDTTKYDYNSHGQQIAETRKDNTGMHYTNKIEYLLDKPSTSYTSVENSMAQKAMFAFPVSTSEVVREEGATGLSPEHYLSKTSYEYNDFQGQGNQYSLKKLNKASYTVEEGITIPSPSDFVTEKNVELRDRLGNIVLVTDRSGVRTCYIWGYKGLYPIAQIENIATISQVKSIAGLGNIDTTPLDGYFTEEQEAGLLDLSNSLVTLYDYKPHVGIIKKTDGSGRVTHYDYDPHGKLTSVIDDHKNLVESYQYNFKK